MRLKLQIEANFIFMRFKLMQAFIWIFNISPMTLLLFPKHHFLVTADWFKFCLRADVLSIADGWLNAFSSSRYASFWIAWVFYNLLINSISSFSIYATSSIFTFLRCSSLSTRSSCSFLAIIILRLYSSAIFIYANLLDCRPI